MGTRVINQLLDSQLCIYKMFENVFENKDNPLYIDVNKKDDYTKFSNYYKKIPSLIRKNGLILTLCFLNKKSSNDDKSNDKSKNDKSSHKPNDDKSKNNNLELKMYKFILDNYINYLQNNKYIDEDKKSVKQLFDYLFDQNEVDNRKLMNLTIISIKYFDLCSQIINAFCLEGFDAK